MFAFFQASFKVGGHMLWRPTHDLSSCTIFIFSRLTCVLKPLGLWKHTVNYNYEKIRGKNWRRSTDFFWIRIAAVKMKWMCCSFCSLGSEILNANQSEQGIFRMPRFRFDHWLSCARFESKMLSCCCFG